MKGAWGWKSVRMVLGENTGVGRRTIGEKWKANVCLLTANDGLSKACKMERIVLNFVDFGGALCYALSEFSPRMGCGMFVLC